MSDTLRELMKQAGEHLATRGIETAALDARLLLQAASGLRQEEIVADPDMDLPAEVTARFQSLIERRCKSEPVSRILGFASSMGGAFG